MRSNTTRFVLIAFPGVLLVCRLFCLNVNFVAKAGPFYMHCYRSYEQHLRQWKMLHTTCLILIIWNLAQLIWYDIPRNMDPGIFNYRQISFLTRRVGDITLNNTNIQRYYFSHACMTIVWSHNALEDPLWRQSWNVNGGSETRRHGVVKQILSCLLLCCVGSETVYVLLWHIVSGLNDFWRLYVSTRNIANKHQNKLSWWHKQFATPVHISLFIHLSLQQPDNGNIFISIMSWTNPNAV